MENKTTLIEKTARVRKQVPGEVYIENADIRVELYKAGDRVQASVFVNDSCQGTGYPVPLATQTDGATHKLLGIRLTELEALIVYEALIAELEALGPEQPKRGGDRRDTMYADNLSNPAPSPRATVLAGLREDLGRIG